MNTTLPFSRATLSTALAALLLAAGPAVWAQAQPSASTSEAAGQRRPTITTISVADADSGAAQVATAGVAIADLPAFTDPAFRDRLRSFIGQPLEPQTLLELLGLINGTLAAAGDRFSVASFPAQEATGGALRIEVRRARLGALNIKQVGEGAGNDEALRRLLRVRPGDLLSLDAVNEDADWIARSNPYRSASVITQPGQAPGTTDLDLVVTSRRPYAFSVGASNAGTRTTGRERINFSAGWGQVFGTDQQLNYSLSAHPGFESYVAHTLGYVVPLPWRHLLSVNANHATIKGRLPAPFDLDGSSSGVSLRYDVLLRPIGRVTHGAYASIEHKRSSNNLLFAAVPVNNSRTEINQFGIGYAITVPDALGSTQAGLSWFHSPGGGGGDRSDAAYNTARLGARSRYDYQTLTLERRTLLPRGWSWVASARLQKASVNLLGSEQLAGGGATSVRSFAEPVAFGDEGFVWRNDFLAPTVRFGESIAVQPLVFYDAARLTSRNPLPGERPSRLSGWGVGLRADFGRGITAQAEGGKRLVADVSGGRAPSQVHLTVAIAF